MKVELVKLDHVPRGWRPVGVYPAGLESAEQIATRVALERGYAPSTKLGWRVSAVPNARPYAEPEGKIEFYVL